MLKLIISLAALLALNVAQPSIAVAKSVSQEFSEAWAERQGRYASEVQASQDATKAAVESLLKADLSNQEDFTARLTAFYVSSKNLGLNAGRLETLRKTRDFMAGKPTMIRTQLWLQEQVDRLRSDAVRSEAKMSEARSLKAGENGLTGLDVIKKSGEAFFVSGLMQGQAEELRSVDQNLATYFRAKGEQDARRRAGRAAALQALGQAFQNSANAYQNSTVNQGWSATCTRMGSFTHCSGN